MNAADTNLSDTVRKLADALTAPTRGSRMFRIEELDGGIGMGLLMSSGTPEQELWGLCSRLCSVSVRELRASKSYTRPVVEVLSQLVCALPEELAEVFDHAVDVLAEEAEKYEEEQKAADEARKAEYEAAKNRAPEPRSAWSLIYSHVPGIDVSCHELAKAKGQTLVALRTRSSGLIRLVAYSVEQQKTAKKGRNIYTKGRTLKAMAEEAVRDAKLPKFW